MDWEKNTQEKFNLLIGKIPVVLRSIAQEKISKKAVALASKENRNQVTEKDLVDAFFSETPFGFHGPMKTDMESVGINYQQYGYER